MATQTNGTKTKDVYSFFNDILYNILFPSLLGVVGLSSWEWIRTTHLVFKERRYVMQGLGYIGAVSADCSGVK